MKTRYFQIGAVGTSLTSDRRDVLEEYLGLYRKYLVDVAPAWRTDIQVLRKPLRFPHRRRYEVIANRRTRYEPARRDEIYPYVEWAINFEVPRTMPEYLQLHASTLQVGDEGVIFPGGSGSGKSTLTTGLVASGFRYLCDEFALIHADTLMLAPFPRAICVKKPSYEAVESVGVSMSGVRHYYKGTKGYVGYVNPLSIRPDAVGESCPIRWVIFPKYQAGEEPRLTPISRAQAAFDLHRVCFNLLSCRTIGLDVIAGMIRGARCFQLVSGEIKATCELVKDLVGERMSLAAAG